MLSGNQRSVPSMRIPKFIEKDLSEGQRILCAKVISVCRRYSEKSQEELFTGALLYCLEVYLRVCVTIDECGGDTVEGFVQAHFRPQVLPGDVMNIAARAMRKLTFDDANEILALAEELGNFRRWDVAKLGSPSFHGSHNSDSSVRTVWSLVEWLSQKISTEWNGSTSMHEYIGAPPSGIESEYVCSKSLGISRFSKAKGDGFQSDSDRVLFVTLGTDSKFLTDDPVSHPEARIFTEGNPQGGLFSPYDFGRGCWRLTIHFSVFNNTDSTCVVFDLHAKVYNRLKKKPGVLASVGHSMAVELLVDNSILGQHAPVNVDPKDSLNIALSLEASLFETDQTTVVFGLLVDYYLVHGNSPVKCGLTSDALYIFQHKWEWKTSKCHFVARTIEEVRKRMKEEPTNLEVQESCRSLLRIFEQHKELSGNRF